MLAALLRSIFVQPDQAAARAQLRAMVSKLQQLGFARAADLLLLAEDDVLAYMAFPSENWRQLHSTNPLERLNKEIRRRSDVVGIFPSHASVVRLVGCLLIEQHEEWSTGRRYFSQDSMKKLLEQPDTPPVPALAAAQEPGAGLNVFTPLHKTLPSRATVFRAGAPVCTLGEPMSILSNFPWPMRLGDDGRFSHRRRRTETVSCSHGSR